jgi:hypothetical protein
MKSSDVLQLEAGGVSSYLNHMSVLRFISIIRDSFIGSQQVYTEGSCYHFHKILKEVFPKAEAYTDLIGHIVTKINDKYYDITGEVKLTNPPNKTEDIVTPSLNKPFNIYKIK